MFERIKTKVLTDNKLSEVRRKHPDKKIIFCTGCYDILQSGHAVFFSQCKELGEILVVGVGFRIGDFTYITDANYISEDEKEKILGSKYLVINGLRKQKHISHFSLGEALLLIEEISPKRAYITHISHQMGFHDDAQAGLPPNVMLAYDGLELTID